ncbi:MAG TPA: transcription-repair coupling factor, partial [Solirubrobacteraceae bacterium]|nr:transcription-repair coupling factor [Solirubrobacteraceae bacterium]
MALRSLLGAIDQDAAASRLAREGGHAFVSSSLRPFMIAALADSGVERPTVVVVGDDRAARDLAGDLRAWLAPRRVRFYPSRGVAYESHLTPPAHLVGLRVAALDALLQPSAEPPVVVVSAVALSEKVPDPQLRPRSFTLRVGELLDLEECAGELVGAGYERVDQVQERGQFAMRGGLLDVFPATEEHAVRVDMFDIEIESLRWFSTFTQRSLGDVEEVEIAPAAELAPEHRELAEIAAATGAFNAADGESADDRPDIAELLPVERFGALLELIGGGGGSDYQLIVAAEEELEPALGDHWSDVCAAFADADAHHLYVSPQEVQAAVAARTRVWLSSMSSGQEIELRASAADTAARSLAEAEPELEKLVRSGYRTVVAFPRRGEGERAAYNLGRLQADWLDGEIDVARTPLEPSLRFAAASLREGFVAPSLKLAVYPEHRLLRRRRAERPGGSGADGRAAGPARRGALRSFTELRTGDIVVHEDHGVARFAGFE